MEQSAIHVDNTAETLEGVAGNIIAIAMSKILKGAGIKLGVRDTWSALLGIDAKFSSKILGVEELKESLNKYKNCHKTSVCGECSKCVSSSDLWIFDSKKSYNEFICSMSGWIRFKLINNIEKAKVGELVIARDECYVKPTSLASVNAVLEKGKDITEEDRSKSVVSTFLYSSINGEINV